MIGGAAGVVEMAGVEEKPIFRVEALFLAALFLGKFVSGGLPGDPVFFIRPVAKIQPLAAG